MENDRNETAQVSRIKGSWDNMVSNLKKHFLLQSEADIKFIPPRQNELLSSIETRLNRYREEVSKVIENSNTERA